MKKRILSMLCTAAVLLAVLAGCGESTTQNGNSEDIIGSAATTARNDTKTDSTGETTDSSKQTNNNKQQSGDGKYVVVSEAFDDGGNCTWQYDYAYDTDGKLKEIVKTTTNTDNGYTEDLQWTYQYDGNGCLLTQETYWNGKLNHTTQYDAGTEMILIDDFFFDGKYGYSDMSDYIGRYYPANFWRIIGSGTRTNIGNGETTFYQYDDHGNLCKHGCLISDISYDRYGNIAQIVSKTTYTDFELQYNNKNQLISQQIYRRNDDNEGLTWNYEYTYDENGFLIGEYASMTDDDGSSECLSDVRFVYDENGHCIEIHDADATWSYEWMTLADYLAEYGEE